MTAAEWDDLARLAEAATPGPWVADHSEEDNSAVKQEGRAWWDGLAFCGRLADAEFIAVANPATILRLIAGNRDLSEQLAQAYRDEVLAHDERDALAARLAAVEALADEWDRENLRRPASDGPVTAYLHECAIDLRAVLSAAPTTTPDLETP